MNIRNTQKRFIAFLLLITFIITSLPLQTLANQSAGGGGTGTGSGIGGGSANAEIIMDTNIVSGYLLSFAEIQTTGDGILDSQKPMGVAIVTDSDKGFNNLMQAEMLMYTRGGISYPPTKLNRTKENNPFLLYRLSTYHDAYFPIVKTPYMKPIIPSVKTNQIEPILKYYTKVGSAQIGGEKTDKLEGLLNDIIKADGINFYENFTPPNGQDVEKYFQEQVSNGQMSIWVEPIMRFKIGNRWVATTSTQYAKITDAKNSSGGFILDARYRERNANGIPKLFRLTPQMSDFFSKTAHVPTNAVGRSIVSVTTDTAIAYDKYTDLRGYPTATEKLWVVAPPDLYHKSGVYIIKLATQDTTLKHPTEINIPPTDFHMTTLKPVPNKDGLLIDLEKGEITLDVRGGYNGDTRGYGEGGNTNVDEDGNNGGLEGADNSSITYKGHPWKETDGSLMENTAPILFAKTASNKDSLTKISCPIHGAYAVPIEDDRLESEFGIPGLARVFNYSVFPNDRLEQEWVENPKGIVADDGCRIFPELQEHLHNKTIETIESNPDTSALLNSKVREALKINGLKLNWDERNISKDFLAKDDRIKFQVYLQTDYQKLQGKGEGIVSYNEHITETMDKNNVSSLPGNKSLKLKVQNNDEGTLTLSWDPNDPKIKETLDYSKSIFVTASINWIEPEDRQTHAYEGDKWLRTESINSNNVQGGNGWINNSLQFELRIPRPNLKANEVTPRYDEEREMICIEGVGFIDKLMPGQNTISSDHTIRLYDANGNLIGEQTKQFKDAQLGTEVDFEEICFKVPKPKPSEEVDYVVEYEINPSEDKPKTEETFEDNIVVNEITIGGDFNWKATNVTASAVNTTPSGIEEFVYKLDVVGQGILEKNELPNTPTYKTDHIIRYWDKENPGSVQEFPLKPTKEVSRGQSIEYSQLQYPDNWLQPEITVPRHTTRVVNILRKRRDCPRC